MCTETSAYRQLLRTTGSSHNLTALPGDDLDSDDDIEKNILPRRPGPTSSPRQTAAVAADGQTDSQEMPRQTTTTSASLSALTSSAKKPDNKQKRCGFIHICLLCVYFGLHVCRSLA